MSRHDRHIEKIGVQKKHAVPSGGMKSGNAGGNASVVIVIGMRMIAMTETAA